MLVAVKIGLKILLKAMLDGWPPLTLRLYQSDTTPEVDQSLADYQEATFSGYRPVPISNWSNPFEVEDGTYAQSNEQPHEFQQDVPTTPLQTVYGYMVTTPWPHLVWAERFAVPVPLIGVNQSITVQPIVSLTNQT